MSGSLVAVTFVMLLIVAARCLLAGEKKRPVPPDHDPTIGFRDPYRSARKAPGRPLGPARPERRGRVPGRTGSRR